MALSSSSTRGDWPVYDLSKGILSLLMTQAQVKRKVHEQNQAIQHALQELYDEMAVLRLPLKQVVPTKAALLDHLGVSAVQFDLGIELNAVLQNPVCKGKLWTLELKLVSFTRPLTMDKVVNVSLFAFSAESPPRMLVANMRGFDLFKGTQHTTLSYDPATRMHRGTLTVRFNEVTSHFKNGWVFLAVLPDEDNEDLELTGLTVRPLIIEQFVSKAKEFTCTRWREQKRVKDIQPEVNSEYI